MDPSGGRKMTKNEFHFNRDLYDSLKDKLLFTPTLAINYIISLPYTIPVKDKTVFDIHFDNLSTLYIFDTFLERTKSALYPDNEKDLDNISKSGIHFNRTRIEMIVLSQDNFNRDDYDTIWSLFHHLLNRLNKFIDSYLMFVDDPNIYPLTFLNLESVVFYQALKLPEFEELAADPLLLHEKTKKIMLPLPQEYYKPVEAVALYLIHETNPFAALRTIFNRSKYFLNNGNFIESVIFMQMSIESFVRTIFKLHLHGVGQSDEEIDAILEDIAFIKIIKEKMPNILGGNWSLTGNNEIAKWYKLVYENRNRIVHGTFSPQYFECPQMLVCTVNAINYIGDRIKKTKKKNRNIYENYIKLPEITLHYSEIDIDEIENEMNRN